MIIYKYAVYESGTNDVYLRADKEACEDYVQFWNDAFQNEPHFEVRETEPEPTEEM